LELAGAGDVGADYWKTSVFGRENSREWRYEGWRVVISNLYRWITLGGDVAKKKN
jgi:hypothetical protein